MTQVERITLVVDGRTFVQEPPTFEQELYIMQMVTEIGLDRLGPSLQLTDDNTDLQPIARQMIVQAYKTGLLFKLMGSLVVEQGQEWTPELAEAQGELFRKTRDPEAKKQLQPALIGAIFAFFESGVSSDLTSHISSDDLAVLAEDQTPGKPSLTPEQVEVAFRTGNMNLPSSRSPITTVSTRPKSSAGKSETDSSPVKRSAGKSRGKSTTKPA